MGQILTIALIGSESDELLGLLASGSDLTPRLQFRRITNFDGITFSISASSSGNCTSKARVSDSGEVIAGFVNRGSCDPYPGSLEEFVKHEQEAALWSLLATFPGPVLNRPSRLGFIPSLDLPEDLIASSREAHPDQSVLRDRAVVAVAGSGLFDVRSGKEISTHDDPISNWLRMVSRQGVLATVNLYPTPSGEVLVDTCSVPSYRNLASAGPSCIREVTQWFASRL